MIKNKFILILILGLFNTSSNAAPTTTQQYYDEVSYHLSNFRKCSLISDQQSKTVSACINNNVDEIKEAREALIKNNPDIIKQILKTNYNSLNSNNGAIAAQKHCDDIYPAALKSHFKNQIASCKAQIDLNLYLKLGATIMKFGG